MDASSNTGYSPSLALGSDDLARISYYSSASTDIMYVHCTSSDCSTHSTPTTIDTSGSFNISMRIGSDGLARIAYQQSTIPPEHLYYAVCSDVDCSAGNVTNTQVDSTSGSGDEVDLALDSNDDATIAYGISTSLYTAKCSNNLCTSSAKTNIGTYNVNDLSIAYSSTGKFYIPFSDSDSDTFNIFTPAANNFNEQYADLSSYGSCSAIPSGNWQSAAAGSQSAGPNFAGAGADDASNGGNLAWSNTSNITAQDISYADSNISAGQKTHYLTATNFGFSVPSGATIDGVVVTVNKEVSLGTAVDSSVKLIKNGVIGGNDKADTVTDWPASSATNTFYGASSDLWGLSLTSSDVNTSNFGVAIAASNSSGTPDPSIDDIKIKVYYTSHPLIAYNDNASVASGDNISSTGNDPTESGQTVQTQTYSEADGFYNTSSFGGTVDGMWDLSLKDNGAPASTTYCLRTAKSDGTPLDTYSQYPMITTASNNNPPGTPALSSPASGATNIDVNPDFTLSSTDADSDHLQYKIVLYDSDCSSAPPPYGTVQTFDQTSAQTNWNGQDQDGGTTYASGSPATYSLAGTPLNFSHTYCWKGAAYDPLGSATFSSFSATQTFTTETLVNHPVNINGNINIYGGTNIY